MSAYDVIIIGTGAGGGTLARRLAPSGQADPAARARRLAAARAAELARAGRVRRQPLRLEGHLVRRRAARRSSRRCTTSSAARRSSTAPRSTACARRTSASCAITTGSRRPGRSPTTSSSRTTRRPSSCTRCTVRAARIRPSRRRARRIRSRPSRTSRASSSSPTTSRRPATTRSTRRAASCSTSRTCRSAPASAARTATASRALVHAKSDAEVIGVRPALEHPNVTLLTNARAVRARDERGGHRRVPGSSSSATARRETFTADIVVVACGAANTAQAAALARPTTGIPNGLANGSDQVGRNYMFHDSQAVLALSQGGEPDRVPEDARAQRLLLRRRRTSSIPMGNIQMVGKSQAPMFRGEKPGETKLAPEWSLERRRQARGRLLALDRGPAAGPRTASRSTATARLTLALHGRRTTSPKERLYEKLHSMLGQLGHARAPSDPPLRVHEERDPGRRRARTRPARRGSAATRRPRSLERRLQGARARQPLRRRHERLPEHRRGQPGADGDGELAARGRPPARAGVASSMAAGVGA